MLPWVVLRAQVEKATGRDILKMAWCDVQSVMENISIINQLERGRGLTAKQIIELQRRSNEIDPKKKQVEAPLANRKVF